MKNPLLYVFLAGAAVLAPYSLRADDANSAPASNPTAGSDTSNGNGQRGERWKEAFAQLDLTDAQKAQIKQIRTSTSPGKERRQQIMAVLTPEQKAKLVEMIKAFRDTQGGR